MSVFVAIRILLYFISCVFLFCAVYMKVRLLNKKLLTYMYLRTDFDFWNVHGIMNISSLLR